MSSICQTYLKYFLDIFALFGYLLIWLRLTGWRHDDSPRLAASDNNASNANKEV